MKTKTQRRSDVDLAAEYMKLFTSYPLPSHGIYNDEDSLEQPSELKYIPSLTVPHIEA